MDKKKRVLLKLSGEALAGEKKTGFDEATVNKFMFDVQSYLTGREISLKSNAVFINATK